MLAAASSVNTKSWVAGLRAAGAEVLVITFHADGSENYGVQVLNHSQRFGKAGYLFAVPRIRQILADIDPDLTIGYYLSSYGLVSALSWRGPLVLAPAGSDILRRTDPITKLVLRYVISRSRLLVVWAQHMVEPLVALGAEERQVLQLPRGIDDTLFNTHGEVATSHREHVVAWTRGLKPVYDPHTAVRSFRLLIDRGVDAEFVMLGDGPLAASTRELIAHLGLTTRVRLEGHVPVTRVAAVLRRADVYLSTTESDGASASLFEAMACGAFPVVTDIPANREWIRSGANGLLVRPRDAAGIADTLASALTAEPLRAAAATINFDIVRARLTRATNVGIMLQRFNDLLEQGRLS